MMSFRICLLEINLCSSGPSDRYRNPVRSGPVCGLGSVSHWSRSGSVRRKFFPAARNFQKKKFGAMRSISSKNRWNRSHPRDFWAVRSLKISHAIFWQIRPIVPGFRRIWLQFDQIPGRSAEFTKKWHVYFWFCHMMLWWYDETMIWWYHDMMIWWYDDDMIWWDDDVMIWWYDDMMIWYDDMIWSYESYDDMMIW